MILCEDGSRRKVFRTIHSGPEHCGRAPSPKAEGCEWEMEMNAQAPKLEAAENE